MVESMPLVGVGGGITVNRHLLRQQNNCVEIHHG